MAAITGHRRSGFSLVELLLAATLATLLLVLASPSSPTGFAATGS